MSKNKSSAMWNLLCAVLMVSLPGCAAAYHEYSGCCIPYTYCTPPPLPYVAYEGCHCPSSGASRYFQQNGASGATAQALEVQAEGPTLAEQEQSVLPASP